jgi:hypothetical protein
MHHTHILLNTGTPCHPAKFCSKQGGDCVVFVCLVIVMFLFDSRSVQFTEYIQKHLHPFQFRNILLSTAAATNFTHGELGSALRKNIACHILMNR